LKGRELDGAGVLYAFFIEEFMAVESLVERVHVAVSMKHKDA
jgi:hypothetical protein